MKITLIGKFTIGVAACAISLPAQPKINGLAGMPPVLDANNVYSETSSGKMSPVVKNHLARVYVPNSKDNTVSVIDPATMKVIDTIRVGPANAKGEPQHVVPSWDLKTLYVTLDLNNTIVPIDPLTGKRGKTMQIDDPYNLYFSPDGKHAIVVAERMRRLDFYDAQTWKVVEKVSVPCRGVDHVDFSVDGKYLIATCEFSAQLVKLDVVTRKVLGVISVPNKGGMPQDIKIAPNGKVWYVADMKFDGLHLVDGDNFKITGSIMTGKGAHGLYPSRDSKFLYVTNRGEGTVSVIDFATNKIVKKWTIPGGGSPDMGGVSVDGKMFWVGGRYDNEVYAINTETGVTTKIKAGKGPHGLCLWPQPGRYSLGHTGILR